MPTFNTVQEKYDHLSKVAKLQRGQIWLANAAMDTPGNPVLILVPEAQFLRPGSPFKKQGYTKFTPSVKAAPPVEAKKVEPLKV